MKIVGPLYFVGTKGLGVDLIITRLFRSPSVDRPVLSEVKMPAQSHSALPRLIVDDLRHQP
jgi:hypothetical protein